MIVYSDLLASIREYKIAEILEDEDPENNVNLQAAMAEAESIVIDFLYSRYNTEVIFAATGSDRSSTILGWLRAITLYKIYERIPDELLPERIALNYEEAMKLLGYVSEGRREIKLARRETSAGAPTTKFRGGSQTARIYK
jgi:Protein of unknown function (DUF1320)